MSPMQEVVEKSNKMLEAGDPAGALEVLSDALKSLEMAESYDLMAKWTLLDEMVACYKALGDLEAVKRVRAEQSRVARDIDSKRATGEIRSRHVVTDKKKDLPSRRRPPPPPPEES